MDEPLPRGALLTRIRRPGVFKHPPKPVLEIRDLIVKHGSRIVIGLDDQGNLAGFSLAIYESEIAILQAPNGWGKSTLFNVVTGLAPIEAGSMHLEGYRFDDLPTWKRVQKGLRALPSGRHAFPSLRVRDAIQLAGSHVSSVDLTPLDNIVCSSLSGGERQKVALYTATAEGLPQRFLLLDEPFFALDSDATLRQASTLLPAARRRPVLILAPSTAVNTGAT